MGNSSRAQSIAQRALRLAEALAALAIAAGCAAPKTPPPPPPELDGGAPAAALAATLAGTPPSAPTGALVVRLAFDAGADLDLYVTDPLTETVYFANTPSPSGTLEADRTCADPAPRIETVVFEKPLPGRYRIGVDHMRSCDRAVIAPFAVQAVRGERRWSAAGALPLGRFDPIVLEIDVE